MNLLSREDIDEGGAVFALLMLGVAAWFAVYTVSLLLRVHWAVALPITAMGFNALRTVFSAIERGADRWWKRHDARVAERAEHPAPASWHRSTVDAISAKNRERRAARRGS
jgi:hypothetical protein